MHEISDELIRKEFEALKFLLCTSLPGRNHDDIHDMRSLFIIAEKAQVISDCNVERLEEMLHGIDRMDLIRRVHQYQR